MPKVMQCCLNTCFHDWCALHERQLVARGMCVWQRVAQGAPSSWSIYSYNFAGGAFLDLAEYDRYVAEMAPEANRQKGTLQVKVQIRDPDKFLTPELTAKVEFLKK